jgi:hypothetical protein
MSLNDLKLPTAAPAHRHRGAWQVDWLSVRAGFADFTRTDDWFETARLGGLGAQSLLRLGQDLLTADVGRLDHLLR